MILFIIRGAKIRKTIIKRTFAGVIKFMKCHMEIKTGSVYLLFSKRLLIYSLIPAFLGAVLYFTLPENYMTPVLPFLIIFFIAVTLISTYILIKSAQKKFIKYLNVYLLTTVIKLFLLVAVMVTYILFNKADLIPFALSFFILYLYYTIFEVVWLVSFFKTDQ